ncbi:MAG: hypothetical protein JST30_17015 [Armatimonadetes bacterium]|nr:hypothetical protein [Armatimonadota bacterium]
MDSPAVQRAAELFEKARAATGVSVLSSLRLAEEAAALDPDLPGVNAHIARCLTGLGRFAEAKVRIEAESRLDPASKEAADLRALIDDAAVRQKLAAPQDRPWASSIRPEALQTIEAAAHRYTYRGHAMIKNPFDLALYPVLLWNLKPATVFEIGSFNGASALWMADLMRTFGIASRVRSLDIVKVTGIEDPMVEFAEGSGRELETVYPSDMLSTLPHPFLVIDDADHTYETSKAVLDHFHPHLVKGDYVVVEDGLTAEGPRRAVEEFLKVQDGRYKVDANYCDFFGYNATWCVNGFLKRLY